MKVTGGDGYAFGRWCQSILEHLAAQLRTTLQNGPPCQQCEHNLVTYSRPDDAYNSRRLQRRRRLRRIHVDKNRTEGTKHEIKGAVKEGIGKVTGNKTKEAAGNIEKNAGKVQKEVGKAADAQRDAHKR